MGLNIKTDPTFSAIDYYDSILVESFDIKMFNRVHWYFDILKVVKERSTCTRKKTSAMIVDIDNFHILSMGYNGVPPNMQHCNEDKCFTVRGHCIGTLHAELNALANLEHHTKDMILISLTQPCLQCSKVIMAFRVKLCIFRELYEDKTRDRFFKRSKGTGIIRTQFIRIGGKD